MRFDEVAFWSANIENTFLAPLDERPWLLPGKCSRPLFLLRKDSAAFPTVTPSPRSDSHKSFSLSWYGSWGLFQYPFNIYDYQFLTVEFQPEQKHLASPIIIIIHPWFTSFQGPMAMTAISEDFPQASSFFLSGLLTDFFPFYCASFSRHLLPAIIKWLYLYNLPTENNDKSWRR